MTNPKPKREPFFSTLLEAFRHQEAANSTAANDSQFFEADVCKYQSSKSKLSSVDMEKNIRRKIRRTGNEWTTALGGKRNTVSNPKKTLVDQTLKQAKVTAKLHANAAAHTGRGMQAKVAAERASHTGVVVGRKAKHIAQTSLVIAQTFAMWMAFSFAIAIVLPLLTRVDFSLAFAVVASTVSAIVAVSIAFQLRNRRRVRALQRKGWS